MLTESYCYDYDSRVNTNDCSQNNKTKRKETRG